MVDAKAAGLKAPQAIVANKVGDLLETLAAKRAILEDVNTKAEALHDEYKKAVLYSTSVAEAMLAVRTVCDELESSVSDEFWPLAKYREMLFIS